MQPEHIVVLILTLAVTITSLLVIQQRKQIRFLRRILNRMLQPTRSSTFEEVNENDSS